MRRPSRTEVRRMVAARHTLERIAAVLGISVYATRKLRGEMAPRFCVKCKTQLANHNRSDACVRCSRGQR